MSKSWVQLNANGLAIRILRSKKSCSTFQAANPDEPVREMSHSEAVGQIRRQVFKRDDYTCIKCGLPVVWERGLPNSGELDEVQARGQCLEQPDGTYQSGEVSVSNCQTLCKNCHTGPGGKQDRSPSFRKSYPALNFCERADCKGTETEFCESGDCKGTR